MVEVRGSERSGDEPVFWTFDMVEARLIETVRCWRRMPGGGRWPYAGDGPWHLITAAARAQTVADFLLDQVQMGHEERPRAGPLLRSEIAAMEEATEWLTWIGDERQRLALVGGLAERARGRKSPGWTALREALADPASPAGLQRRYERAIGFIANVLNARSGQPWARNGVRVRYPKAVVETVERLEMAENCARNVSRPGK